MRSKTAFIEAFTVPSWLDADLERLRIPSRCGTDVRVSLSAWSPPQALAALEDVIRSGEMGALQLGYA